MVELVLGRAPLGWSWIIEEEEDGSCCPSSAWIRGNGDCPTSTSPDNLTLPILWSCSSDLVGTLWDSCCGCPLHWFGNFLTSFCCELAWIEPGAARRLFSGLIVGLPLLKHKFTIKLYILTCVANISFLDISRNQIWFSYLLEFPWVVSVISVFLAPLESFCEDVGAEQEELTSFTSMAKDTRAWI